LFFLWGFAHSLLDVLNKHFQNILNISRAESGKVQFAVYGGYFLMALPAGMFMKRFGYQKGIILGLLLYAIGAFLFYPAAMYVQTFNFMLFCLFLLACGLTFLETAANPYVTVLGPKESSEQRINLAQSFNGIGWILGPLIGGMLIFSENVNETNKFASVSMPYMIVGSFVMFVAIFFIFVKLPEISGEADAHGVGEVAVTTKVVKPLFQNKHFVLAIIAQLTYVAAQTGINSFFINYVVDAQVADELGASTILAFGGMGLFFLGRFSGSYMMRTMKANKLLFIYSLANIILVAIVMLNAGWLSVVALFSTYFFMSIMFPTIFALGLKDLGPHTKKAASFIIMAIVGGAICPMFMGWVADKTSMSIGFVVPLLCFVYVAYYGLKGYKVENV